MPFMSAVKTVWCFLASLFATKANGQVSSSIKSDDGIKMKTENGYYIWQKGEKESLSDHFSTQEFTCQCNHLECVDQRIAVELIEKLTTLRNDCAFSLIITSGYRCAAHQIELGESGLETAKNSQHVLGNAADVAGKDVEKIFVESEKLFKSRGKAKSFIHLDLRSDKIRLWYYTKS